MSGPLAGLKIIEIAGIGPGQLAGMLLADLGATLLRIDRKDKAERGIDIPAKFNLMNRSRPAIGLDLKSEQGRQLVLDLTEQADALFEGYRPGVMERFGLGPNDCLKANPRLVYGRMTGWGQDGPLAQAAGHDPNYIALTGVLASIGEKNGAPVYPLNLIGDFGGGALYLAFGLLAGIIEARKSGQGQIVDVAMVDGIASMMTLFHGLLAGGMWREARASNFADTGAPNVGAYETKDGQFMAVGAIEPKFFNNLLAGLELDLDARDAQDPGNWEPTRTAMQAAFRQRTRAEWEQVFAGVDACVSPVLSLSEATQDVHLRTRGTYVEVDGISQPAPAPRFSRTPGRVGAPPAEIGSANQAALGAWGLSETEVRELEAKGVLA